ncbi:helix-turn-helix transcriptional regulator [Rhodopseudomonas sp. BR0C11]|uniref:helix-turn-helix transcriptional regulator n=1 Tax=Rhodopseudomonas sp. BR0C11 TaxID=2269370 RepID=UPI0032DFCC35
MSDASRIDDAVRVMVETLDAVSVHTVVLGGDGRCISISPCAETLLSNGSPLTVQMERLRRSKTSSAVAECPRLGSAVDIDHDLQPCIDCVTRRNVRAPCSGSCAISITGPHDAAVHLRLTAIAAADQQALTGAAAMAVIRPLTVQHSVELLPDIAVLLTAAERDVATELLSGRRPAEIAQLRGVSIGTIRSQIKRIYAKLGVSGLVEFIARARR